MHATNDTTEIKLLRMKAEEIHVKAEEIRISVSARRMLSALAHSYEDRANHLEKLVTGRLE